MNRLILLLAVFLVGCGATPVTATRSTEQPTAMSTTVPTVTHERPHFGGPLSDFAEAYGKPTDLNQPYHFPDGQKTITVYADDYRGIGENDVSSMTITNTAAWIEQDGQAYCAKFVPSDAALEATNSYNGETRFLYNSASTGYKFALVIAHNGGCVFSLPKG